MWQYWGLNIKLCLGSWSENLEFKFLFAKSHCMKIRIKPEPQWETEQEPWAGLCWHPQELTALGLGLEELSVLVSQPQIKAPLAPRPPCSQALPWIIWKKIVLPCTIWWWSKNSSLDSQNSLQIFILWDSYGHHTLFILQIKKQWCSHLKVSHSLNCIPFAAFWSQANAPHCHLMNKTV